MRLTVTVERGEDGALTVTGGYTDDPVQKCAESSSKTAEAPATVVFAPAVRKILEGDWTGDELPEFTCERTAVDTDAPTPESTSDSGVASMKIAADPTKATTGEFGEIEYSAEDLGETYTYKIEVVGEVDGVVNDPDAVRTLTVTVSGDEEDGLQVTGVYSARSADPTVLSEPVSSFSPGDTDDTPGTGGDDTGNDDTAPARRTADEPDAQYATFVNVIEKDSEQNGPSEEDGEKPGSEESGASAGPRASAESGVSEEPVSTETPAPKDISFGPTVRNVLKGTWAGPDSLELRYKISTDDNGPCLRMPPSPFRGRTKITAQESSTPSHTIPKTLVKLASTRSPSSRVMRLEHPPSAAHPAL